MQKKFIIFIVLVILIVAGTGYYLNKGSISKPGKFDQFAQSLKDNGAKFYGAFWCTHCQAQKAKFGTSKQYLPYIECSNPDNSPTQVCLDNKIESYPTWTFKDGITLTSEKEPLICPIKTDTSVESPDCQDRSSKYYKTWFFPDYGFAVKSSTDPSKEGSVWKFPVGAETSGELPLPFLAEQIKFVLPQ